MAGACLTLLAVVALASGSARAGCLKPHDSAAHFEHLIRAGALPDDAAFGSESTLPGQPPKCSGPQCTRGPATPPASSWTAPVGPDTWACLAERLRLPAECSSFLPDDASPAPPKDRAKSIFHPPKRSPL